MRSKTLPAVSRWQNKLVCGSISLPHGWVKYCVRNNCVEPEPWIFTHALHYQHMGSTVWVKSTILSSSNTVPSLVIAYRGKCHSKASCCWNMRTKVGHCSHGLGREVWWLAILSWQWWVSLSEHQSCSPPPDEGKEHAWLEALASLLTFWWAGH